MIEQEAFRRAMGNFAAGVTVVTLPEPFHGITVNAFASVSLSPTFVMICIDHDTETHERLSAGNDGYCVNILAGDQRHLGEHFANMIELDETPFESEPTETGVTGAPIFKDALAYLDCSVAAAHEAGDHTLYVGTVEDVDVQRPTSSALTYFRGEWGTIE